MNFFQVDKNTFNLIVGKNNDIETEKLEDTCTSNDIASQRQNRFPKKEQQLN